MIQKKICLLGASSVGKTSLIKQFVEGIFSEKYLTTIGVKVDKKSLVVDDDEINFMLWDIEGNDRYNVFEERYLRGAAGYIIVVDQTRASSLIEGLDIHTLAKQVTSCPAVLAINKSDLPSTWHFSALEQDAYQKLFDLQFTTSAKTGEHVDDMFLALAALLLKDKKNDITTE
jgi:small GTP-binding protein